MKLQRQKTWERKGKQYGKWVIVLPSKDIKKLGWKEGNELFGEIKRGKYCLSVK